MINFTINTVSSDLCNNCKKKKYLSFFPFAIMGGKGKTLLNCAQWKLQKTTKIVFLEFCNQGSTTYLTFIKELNRPIW